jgi:hypothetical protein
MVKLVVGRHLIVDKADLARQFRSIRYLPSAGTGLQSCCRGLVVIHNFLAPDAGELELDADTGASYCRLYSYRRPERAGDLINLNWMTAEQIYGYTNIMRDVRAVSHMYFLGNLATRKFYALNDSTRLINPFVASSLRIIRDLISFPEDHNYLSFYVSSRCRMPLFHV